MKEATAMIDRTLKHPDAFDDMDAVSYLRLEGRRSLDLIIRDFGLKFYKIGRKRIFYRPDLDACFLRLLGKDKQDQPQPRQLRMSGGHT